MDLNVSPKIHDVTLCSLLGLSMDFDLGACKVGRLPAAEISFLHENSSSHPFRGEHCSAVGEADPFNPSNPVHRNEYFHEFAEVDSRDCDDLLTDTLAAMLPALRRLKLRFTYLKCDYLKLHDDLGMRGFDHPYSMAILLSAPHGCNLVTGGDRVSRLEVGDVVIINDQLKHGAYPVNAPERTDESHLSAIGISEQDSFVERNCLSFLLVCAEDTGEALLAA